MRGEGFFTSQMSVLCLFGFVWLGLLAGFELPSRQSKKEYMCLLTIYLRLMKEKSLLKEEEEKGGREEREEEGEKKEKD